ncbi:transposase [Desulfosarcina sp. OttesenSCG-928-B08]|nr:transposase [Desulfosarcina sp. OttesenSCG-928-B08]
MCKRIEVILKKQIPLFPAPYEIEKYAQEFAARIIAEGFRQNPEKEDKTEVQYEEIDVDFLEFVRPRSVGVEHVSLHGANLLQLRDILQKVGLSQPQVSMALASIVGRMAKPASENATWKWLTTQVIMDRGVATEATLEWLVQESCHYLVVSRERARTFDMSKAQTIRTAQKQELQVYRELTEDQKEARLYCYSSSRAAKEEAIVSRFVKKFEDGLRKLAEGLTKPHTDKKKDTLLKRIGRLAEKSHGISQHYTLTITDNADTQKPGKPLLAMSLQFEKIPVSGNMVTHPGVYCLRTTALWLDAEKLWRTYVLLTDLEAVFRSLKSELGLRPVYHQTTERAEGHLFITVLAYQCVQAIRNTLKSRKIHDSWQTLRETMTSQRRVTATFRHRNGTTLHIRKTTLPEADQQRIYEALGINSSPVGVKRHQVPGPTPLM